MDAEIAAVAESYWDARDNHRFGACWDLLCADDQAVFPRATYVARFEGTPVGRTYFAKGPVVSVEVDGEKAVVKAAYRGPEKRAFHEIIRSGRSGDAAHQAIQSLPWVLTPRRLKLVREAGGWRVDGGIAHPDLEEENRTYREGLRRLEFQLVATDETAGPTWMASDRLGGEVRLERTFFLQPPGWSGGTLRVEGERLLVHVQLKTKSPMFWLTARQVETAGERILAVVFAGEILGTVRVREGISEGTLIVSGSRGMVDLDELRVVLSRKPGALFPRPWE